MNQKPPNHVPGYSTMANQGGDNAYRNPHPHPGYAQEQMQSYGGRPGVMMPGHYPGMYPPGYEEQIRAQAMMRQPQHMQSMHHMAHPSMRAQIPIIMSHPSQVYGVHPQADVRSMPTGRMPNYEAAGEVEEQNSSEGEPTPAVDSKAKHPTDARQSYGEQPATQPSSQASSSDAPRSDMRLKPRQATSYRELDEGVVPAGEGEEEEDDSDTLGIVQPGAEATGRWTKDEHDRFLEGLRKHGKEWKKVAAHVATRTVVQTRTHAQKYFQKLHKSGGAEEVEMGIDTTNVSSTGTSARRSQPKRRKASPDTYEKRRRADTEDSEENIPSLDDRSPVSSTHAFQPMSIIAPDPTAFRFDIPQPSPATCGKRKDAELTAVEMLAATFDDKNAGQVLSMMRTGAFEQPYVQPSIQPDPTRKRRVGLSIINPDQLPSINGGAGPETPWNEEIRALEARRSHYEMSVSTPSERKECIAQMRHLITTGALPELTSLIQAAAVAETTQEMTGTDLGESDDVDNSSVADGAEVKETESKDAAQASSSALPSEPSSATGSEKPAQSGILAQMLNRRTSVGVTMLMLACDLNPAQLSEQDVILPICNLLLDHGASVTGADKQGRTCLHRACSRNMILVMRLLLRKGCSINALDQQGNTALHIASMYGLPQALQLLTESGINCHVRNKDAKCAADIVYDNVPSARHEQRSVLRKQLLTLEPRLRTLVLYHPECLEHTPRRHTEWEGPARLQGVLDLLQSSGAFNDIELEFSRQFERASVELLSRVHSSDYISFVSQLSRQLKDEDANAKPVPFTPMVQRALLRHATGELKSAEYCDTSFSVGSLNAARRAAGAVADAVDKVLLGRYRNAFCLVRPPGHHAGYRGLLDDAKSCGFCIFNNVAAGALHALEVHRIERVAIIDIDIHHGNGTEDIVRQYAQPSRLFFFSIHLMDKEPTYEFFPGSGQADDTAHNIINVPVAPLWKEEAYNTRRSGGPSTSGREAFRNAILQRLLPTLRAFNPQLILLSAGFDAAAGDVGNAKHFKAQSTAGMDLHGEDFEWVTSKIVEVADICCNGRLVSVLEGGYGTWQTHSKPSRSSGKLAPSQDEALDRSVLAESVSSHLSRLVDPYGIQSPLPTFPAHSDGH